MHVEDYLTTSELAAATNTVTSGWRIKAERGKLPGAIKRGGVWLIPFAAVPLKYRERVAAWRHEQERKGETHE